MDSPLPTSVSSAQPSSVTKLNDLPSEILQMIFLLSCRLAPPATSSLGSWCLDETFIADGVSWTNKDFMARHLYLTWVCRHWRSLITTDSRFWTWIDINHRHHDFIEEVITRSQQRKLNLILRRTVFYPVGTPHTTRFGIINQSLDRVRDRIRSLKVVFLSIKWDDFQYLCSDVLQDLGMDDFEIAVGKIDFSHTHPPTTRPVEEILKGFSASKAIRVDMPSLISIPWSLLATQAETLLELNLSLYSQYGRTIYEQYTDLFRLLASCRSLEKLGMKTTDLDPFYQTSFWSDWMRPGHVSTKTQFPLTMQYLKEVNTSGLTGISALNLLTLPSLRSVIIKYDVSYDPVSLKELLEGNTMFSKLQEAFLSSIPAQTPWPDYKQSICFIASSATNGSLSRPEFDSERSRSQDCYFQLEIPKLSRLFGSRLLPTAPANEIIRTILSNCYLPIYERSEKLSKITLDYWGFGPEYSPNDWLAFEKSVLELTHQTLECVYLKNDPGIATALLLFIRTNKLCPNLKVFSQQSRRFDSETVWTASQGKVYRGPKLNLGLRDSVGVRRR